MTDCITTADLWTRVNGADRPRWCIEKMQDDTGRWVPKHYATCVDPSTCRGCVPRPAEGGTHLCRSCTAKAKDALERASWLILHLRSVEKSAQPLRERVDTSATRKLVVPDSWIAADGILEALGSSPMPANLDILTPADWHRMVDHVDAALEPWVDFDQIIASREGAKRAVVLVKRMTQALQRWPDAEVNWRHVPLILCPGCGQQTLYRRGPLEHEDDLLIECAESPLMYEVGIGYDYCTWALDWFIFLDTYAEPIEAAVRIHMDRQKRKTA